MRREPFRDTNPNTTLHTGADTSAQPGTPPPRPDTDASPNGRADRADAPPPKPAYRFGGELPVALAHLRDREWWVCWDYRRKGKKWTKPPFDPRTGRNASVSNAKTWATFDVALAGMKRYGFAGVGLVLIEGGGISGADLDDCITDDGPSALAAEIIAYGESYTEESPSGRGLRIFISGQAPTLNDGSIRVEMYSSGRFLTVTGRHIDGTPNELGPAPRTLAKLVAAVDAARGEKRAKPNGARPNGKTQNGNDHARAGGDFFKNVNAAALARLDDWVPTLHPTARKHATGAWRISSADLGRDLEEDLSYHSDGIRDHGEECGLTPIDAVQRYGAVGDDAVAAAMWLCQRLCIESARLGWRGRASNNGRAHANGNGTTPPRNEEPPPHEREPDGPLKQSAWPDPVPLPTSLLPVAPFDYDMLPERVMPWARDVCERMQCPPDYIGVSVMVALSSLIGRKVTVRPQRNDDWAVTPNLWALLIGRPGIMKSPAMEDSLRPLKMLANDARERFALAKVEYELRATTAKAKAKHVEKEAAKALSEKKGDDFVRDLIKRHQTAGDDEPICKRYIATNVSVEALGVLLQQNPNGVLVHRDEMLSLLDRLDEEGHADERGFYLTGWAGNSAYTFDRIGRGLDLHIEAVCLSMLGGTPPGRISQYLVRARRGGRGDDGLIQRFGLMVWPDIPAVWTNVDRKPDGNARNAAFRVFQALDGLDWHVVGAKRDFGPTGDEVGDPYLRLSGEAHVRFVAWRTELERRLRQDGLDPALESHLAKYRKLVPGLALIIHLADGQIGEVSPAAVERALRWAHYLETHAVRAYASTTIASADAARAIVAKIRSGHLLMSFRSHEVWRPQWSLLKDRETVQAALQLLVEYDWLRVAKVETCGHPGTVFTVNPKVGEQPNAP